jgi:NAD(P)-dependent dehydrogenase (short-subunit alcohol dehydrogenase family)
MLDLSQAALDRALAAVFAALPHLHSAATADAGAVTVGSLACDVTREADIEAAVRAVDGWGGVDVFVNTAGIMHADDADAVGTSEKVWDLTMAVNVKGVWFGSKHAVLSLRKHEKKRGSVINVASVVALVGSATPQLAYTASKGAVLALTRELAIVHAREGFRFNALCPAPLK